MFVRRKSEVYRKIKWVIQTHDKNFAQKVMPTSWPLQARVMEVFVLVMVQILMRSSGALGRGKLMGPMMDDGNFMKDHLKHM